MNSYGSGFIAIINYSSLAENVTPTPGSDFRITDDGNRRITDDASDRITD